ncbi:nucleic acid dioxygenase ALKBH1 [Maniola jurtina]|uniref:nucleic acid dioxygenase ALKBH1 n=1 Tax=Maniola jurtina TaxID=191418 RepID=UPI001E68D560|nr:nucleic acid dioxygenase ALKBH1 [Maniola jurtina]
MENARENADNDLSHDLPQYESMFMKSFKYYKSKRPLPSLEQVINYEYCDKSLEMTTVQCCLNNNKDPRASSLGLQDSNNWKMFEFENHPGLLLIKDPFTSMGQKFWIRKCLEEYPKKPNKTNIDVERHIEDWWRDCHKGNKCDKNLKKKLRWTTLGYHHNWDSKVYSEDNRTTFPVELAELCDVVAHHLGFEGFRAEAAIVNYYHMGSTLSAHTDHSEVNLEAPLFSFSFGQSAIFLIGGHDKSKEPLAILLNSGDIVVMSKEARLCYHAVPKILPASTQPWNKEEHLISMKQKGTKFKFIDEAKLILEMERNIENKEWSKFNSYVEESRININVRQVLNANQESLLDCKNNT